MENRPYDPSDETGIDRRSFLGLCLASGSVFALTGTEPLLAAAGPALRLKPDSFTGKLQEDGHDSPIDGATWYRSIAEGDGLLYRFAPGALKTAKYLTADMLLDGNYETVFQLLLQEGENGPTFRLGFALLNQCSARFRMPMSAVDLNRWMFPREGAWLKPLTGGDRVNLGAVDRMYLKVLRNGGKPARWCLTDFFATPEEVERIAKPILPKGALLDEMGQSRLHEWPGKSRTTEEVSSRLKAQLQAAGGQKWPEGFSRYGGSTKTRVDATGFFRTHNDGKRWWLVDPEGYLFWSAGVDCVRVDTDANYGGLETALSWMPERRGAYKTVYSSRRETGINYLAANFARTFGADWYQAWKKIALGEIRRLGFNTVANWSDWQIAREAGVPYVRPLSPEFLKTPNIYRDFPDVFAPSFAAEAAAFGRQLADTADDPAFVGYFLMNEPTWGFSTELPAVGMLYNTPECATRRELAKFLRNTYPDAQALSKAWEVVTSFDEISGGIWTHPLKGKARVDLEAFSGIMVDVFFQTLSQECKKVDSHHMNLGIRYQSVPPAWVVKGMKTFDVFSMNCYREKVPFQDTEETCALLNMPVMIGEWHFGALDVGLPASGIGHVRDQNARGEAYRVYLEDAAANPFCVGVHWFTLYDQSALGRFDGENYNIGFLDVCNSPYEGIGAAALESHRRVYEVASGSVKPYADAPEYLPRLFM